MPFSTGYKVRGLSEGDHSDGGANISPEMAESANSLVDIKKKKKRSKGPPPPSNDSELEEVTLKTGLVTVENDA